VVLELAHISGRPQREVAAELALPLGTGKARTFLHQDTGLPPGW